MTKSTLIRLKVFYFFPLNKKLLLRLEKIKNKNRLSKYYSWYRRYSNNMFDLLSSESWQEKTQVKIQNSFIDTFDIGGSGHFKLELVKKYRILTKKRKIFYRYRLALIYITYFLNKYNEYANQRNTD